MEYRRVGPFELTGTVIDRGGTRFGYCIHSVYRVRALCIRVMCIRASIPMDITRCMVIPFPDVSRPDILRDPSRPERVIRDVVLTIDQHNGWFSLLLFVFYSFSNNSRRFIDASSCVLEKSQLPKLRKLIFDTISRAGLFVVITLQLSRVKYHILPFHSEWQF